MDKIIITVGRQYGSGGRLIGEKVAEALGLDFYSRNLIDMVAEKSGFAKEYIKKRDGMISSRFIWASVPGDMNMGALFTPNYYTNVDKMYFTQSEIIKELAEKGNCVIVGRCADYILRDRENCFKVFVQAHRKDRIQRAVDKYGVEPAKAAKIIDNTDAGRARYYRQYTDMTWGDRRRYDLCVSSSTFGIDGAVKVIVNAAKEFMNK